MKISEAIKALKGKGYAYGWVNITEDDGTYLALNKAQLIAKFQKLMAFSGDIEINAEVRKDGDFYLS